MKKLELFQCEFCNTQYQTETGCLTCESSHIKPKSIKSCRYHAEKNSANYPDAIIIHMENGKDIKYKR